MSNVKNRGFASLSEEKRKEIASFGGKASHAQGTAYKFTHEKAVEAGKKGRKKSYGTTATHI